MSTASHATTDLTPKGKIELLIWVEGDNISYIANANEYAGRGSAFLRFMPRDTFEEAILAIIAPLSAGFEGVK